MQNIGQDELISTAEVAEILGVDVATVNRRAQRGEIPTFVKSPGLRGARFFKRSDVVPEVRMVEEVDG